MTMNVTVNTPDSAAMQQEADSTLMMAQTLSIDSPALYELAAGDLKSVKRRITELDEQRKAITKPLDTAKAAVMDLFRAPIERLQQAESQLKQAMLTYQREQERIAAEQRRIAEANAASERARLQAEANQRAAEAAKLAEAAEKDPFDTAAAAAAASAQFEAEVIQATAQVITAPAIQSEAPKVAGISKRVTWDAEVVSIVELCAYIAKNPEMSELVTPNTKALKAMATAMKDKLAIPGVNPISKESLASR